MFPLYSSLKIYKTLFLRKSKSCNLCQIIMLNIYFISFVCLHFTGASQTGEPLLLVILFDGFRYDYVNKTSLPNFKSLINRGAYIRQLQSVFVTKSFPNQYTLVTGRYVEDHGVLGFNVYDPETGHILSANDSALYNYNKNIIPIWNSNEKLRGHYSGSVMWNGAHHVINNHSITYKKELNSSMSWLDRAKLAISWFKNSDKPANLVLLYIEEPDLTGHSFGPDSPEVVQVLKKIDSFVGHVMDLLKAENLIDDMNVIFLTDHGMENVDVSHVIDLEEIVGPGACQFFGVTPVLHVLPNTGQDIQVYEKLREASKTHNFTVYYKDVIPDELHYKFNQRILNIIVIADEGFSFQDLKNASLHGNHGYYPNFENMYGFFIGFGPQFRTGVMVKKARNLDVYPLMCHILGIDAGPHNGSLDEIGSLLKQTMFDKKNRDLLIGNYGSERIRSLVCGHIRRRGKSVGSKIKPLRSLSREKELCRRKRTEEGQHLLVPSTFEEL